MKHCLIALLAIFAIGMTNAEDKEKVKKPALTYYFFDGWVKCDEIKVIVNDLKKVYGEKIEFSMVSMSKPEAVKAVEKSKLKSHGIIAKSTEGKIVKTVEGHNYKKPKVEKVIEELLEKS